MTVQDIFDKHSSMIAICMVDDEEGTSELEKFHNEFNKKYKIVPKEQWCVGITTSGSYCHQVGIQGPFDNELEAKIFADIWNRKRDEYIDKTIEENPDEEFEFQYLLAKPYKLEVSEKNLVIMDEMISLIEAGINKIQGVIN